LTAQFEKLLLAGLLKDEKFLKETIGFIDDEAFSNLYNKYFFNIIKSYYGKNHKTMPFEVFKFYIQKTLPTQGFEDEELPIIIELIADIFSLELDNSFIMSELGPQIKKNKLQKILEDAQYDLDIGDISGLLEDITNINKYDPEDEKPLEYTSSLHLRSTRNKPIKTHIDSLDTEISGGIAPGEFGLISAQTGGCKSTILLNFAYAAVRQSKKVLFLTLEDSQDTVFMRFDSLFSNTKFRNFREDPTKSLELKNKVEKHKGLLFVKDYSSGTCGVDKIRSVLSSMPDVDMLIVDYLDELGSGTKRGDRWQEVEDAARQLKALASDFKIPIWTATQTSSGSYGKEYVGLQHIYGGKGKAHISHIVLTVVQTEEELKENKLRILVSKQKAGPKGGEIKCCVDLSKVRIFDAKTT